MPAAEAAVTEEFEASEYCITARIKTTLAKKILYSNISAR